MLADSRSLEICALRLGFTGSGGGGTVPVSRARRDRWSWLRFWSSSFTASVWDREVLDEGGRESALDWGSRWRGHWWKMSTLLAILIVFFLVVFFGRVCEDRDGCFVDCCRVGCGEVASEVLGGFKVSSVLSLRLSGTAHTVKGIDKGLAKFASCFIMPPI